MKYSNLSEISLGHIQAFVSVVDFQGFTAAAEYLHISQPVVSKRVAYLEQILEMQLIVRSKSNFHLTPAGRILYDSWKKMLTQMNESVNSASLAVEGNTRNLKIGYLATTVLKKCGDAFRLCFPEIELYYTKLQYPEMKAALASGEIDVMIYGSFAEVDIDEGTNSFKRLFSAPLNICCSPDHPFYNRSSVTVDELEHQHFIMLAPNIAPMWVRMVIEMCTKHGFTPSISMYVEDVSSLAMNTYGDNKIFVSDTHVSYDGYNLKKIPIENEMSGLTAVWRSDNPNKAIDQFVGFAVEHYKTASFINDFNLTLRK